MSTANPTIRHPTLHCSLRGQPSTNSIQFRNLKYASIPSRYQDPILHTPPPSPNTPIDATTFGPSCPQHQSAQSWDLNLLGTKPLPLGASPGPQGPQPMDEFHCLHLNMTVPKCAIDTASRCANRALPVLVWVHGGGLAMGANSWPQYDLQRLVDRSVDMGKPIVGVGVNYRVGVFGFMGHGEVGAGGNMGLKDLVVAFGWVRRYVGGFGGDAGNVCAAGESAGGILLSTLLCAEVEGGLFDRVVLMSGETMLRKPRGRMWHEEMYKDQAVLLGMDARHGPGLRTRLKDTDAEVLAHQLPLSQHFCPLVDGKFLRDQVSQTLLSDTHHPAHKPQWCKSLVIGDTLHDGTILESRILTAPNALQRLKISCAKHLSDHETQTLLHAYKLNAQLPPEQQQEMLLNLVSELRFYDPARRAHRAWRTCDPPRCAFRYHFHIRNPFQGRFKGKASHELDVAFLLQHFNDGLDGRLRGAALAMADHFIGYVCGGPWAGEGKVVVFETDGVREVDEAEYDMEYREGRGAVLDGIDGDKLWRVAEMWQGVRSDGDDLQNPDL